MKSVILVLWFCGCTLAVPLDFFFPYGSDAGDSEFTSNWYSKPFSDSSKNKFVYFNATFIYSDIYVSYV